MKCMERNSAGFCKVCVDRCRMFRQQEMDPQACVEDERSVNAGAFSGKLVVSARGIAIHVLQQDWGNDCVGKLPS